MTTPSGLQIIDSKVGTGASPKTGQTCVMHYTGWLYENGAKGKKFDSSVDRGQPFEFPIGTHRVIPGWDEGVATMKVGGKRTLIIPPQRLHAGFVERLRFHWLELALKKEWTTESALTFGGISENEARRQFTYD